MGTIKDITDLTVDLINSTQDRKLTAKITSVQSLIATLQSEHSTIVEENLTLRNKIFELEKRHADEIFAVEEKFSAKKLQDKYDFIKKGVEK